MDIPVATDVNDSPRKALRLRHALLVYTTPRSLFARVEDTGSYGTALATLLGLVTLLGYIQIQSGLIDRVVDQQTEVKLAELEEAKGGLVDRAELTTGMEAIRKEAEFNKTISRLGVVVWSPIYFLASFLLIASVLYAMVALTGRKPEYQTLMSICVYAGFLELAGYVVHVAMMLYYRTTQVDTTLGMLVPPGEMRYLTALDPFRIWFWVLVAVGVAVTHQLSRRMAVVSCFFMGAVAIGARVAMAVALPS